ncbi:hypothetical protein OG585_36025 [Streptomyces sp. NBC_01340]|nr:hypothetical protein [Streptomyces sp. NBC_01719]MCX4497316.1 hypothetical protein [Streptomyces sp. NBC_01728]WSI42164.1 hypothetical protein OG585_36025 [Streptomyces sp. NBC_01340]
MKAAVYEGPRTVTVKDVPDAKIEHPCDTQPGRGPHRLRALRRT